MKTIHCALSLMQQPSFLEASLPLFEEDIVDALSWSFDCCWSNFDKSPWIPELLKEYGAQDRLYGHGVHFSLLDGNWTEAQQIWLENLDGEVNKRSYKHITEHFGYMSRKSYGRGAPLPPPLNEDTFNLAVSRLEMLVQTASCPIGLENLAFAFSKKGVIEQYKFLNRLLENRGILLLDLHNLYCQIENFGISLEQILSIINPQLVHEIHISGGSWSFVDKRPIRRDTHDDTVPEPVFELLSAALPQLPNVEVVTFERLAETIHSPEHQQQFRRDFKQMKEIVAGVSK